MTANVMYARESKPFGRSWEQWVAIWWQWCSAEPDDTNPVADMTGEICDKNQTDSDVWFLAGTFGGEAERTCIIPAGKAIFFHSDFKGAKPKFRVEVLYHLTIK